jgi:AraC family transcriptional regulator of adaptative response/methylated-DNA-[protein]-cysteine methyltransferase
MSSDYEKIAQAIKFIEKYQPQQPTLVQIAKHLHMSQFHFQRLFSRWVGITPKKYLQILTVDRAKKLLATSETVFETSLNVGLTSTSRLHDHFVQLEACTPGEYKTGGIDMPIHYDTYGSPFGEIFMATTERGICKLVFIQNESIDSLVPTLAKTWPHSLLTRGKTSLGNNVETRLFQHQQSKTPLSLFVKGTNFQIKVWRALLNINRGQLTNYMQIANAIGQHDANRAVGSAIGANPIALLIPCHRVVQKSGGIGGYRWGATRKHAIHAWENAGLDC